MRKEYDFTKARKNPYAAQLKKQITNNITGAANSVISRGANTITAATDNNITAANNKLTATVANDIQGPVNRIGTTAGVTTNTIGNTTSGTTVTTQALNASQVVSEGRANTSVTGGTSRLTARTGIDNTATTAQVLLTNIAGTTVDANGKILTAANAGYVAPTAPTAALTLTNGYGNTHGVVVTESQTTLSGGTQSSSLTLSDTNARFSRASDGAPITVTGVADGKADFDAVNVRQYANAISGLSAMANIPAPETGKSTVIGVGVGHFMNKSALALGVNHRLSATSMFKASLATGMHNGAKPILGAGVGWAW